MHSIGVIPDSHVKPNQNLRRFGMAAKLFVEHKPEIIICLGDWADMESLCHYDYGHKSFEGRRVENDFKACKEALESFNHFLHKYSRGTYKPRKVMLLGNHENRINKAIEVDPKIDGLFSIKSLGFKEAGWEVVKFLEIFQYAGISFTHYFTSGVMGKGIGGKSPAKAMLNHCKVSAVAGHTHIKDQGHDFNALNQQIQTLVAGCFMEHDEAYSSECKRWWRGLWILKSYKRGTFEAFPYSMDELKATYLKK